MNLEMILEEFIISYGLLSIFILVALEYANLPLPSEVILPLIGMVSFGYELNIIEVIIVSTLGGIFGSLINYYLGYYLGDPIVVYIKKKIPKTKKSIKASYHFLQKYDKISVLLSRLIPLARTFISIIAGVIRMNVGTFTIYSSLGILIWNSILISAGYIVSDNIAIIGLMISRYSILVGIIGLIGVSIYIYIMKIKSRNIEDECSTGEEY